MAEPTLRVDTVIPVYNEEKALPGSIQQLNAFLTAECRHDWRIVIADNASVDRTPEVGRALAEQFPRVRYERLERKGRGLALRTAWLGSDADILSYMDVDLSTDLACLPELIGPLRRGEADLAIGSRLLPASRTTRGLKREVLSRGYSRLLRWALGLGIRDAQCGFKAITRQAARVLLPQVQDEGWFFDTELLWLAQRGGWRIREIPVTWVDDPTTTVKLLPTIWRDLRGVWRLRRSWNRVPERPRTSNRISD